MDFIRLSLRRALIYVDPLPSCADFDRSYLYIGIILLTVFLIYDACTLSTLASYSRLGIYPESYTESHFVSDLLHLHLHL